MMKRLPAEIEERLDGQRHRWCGTRPRDEVELSDSSQFITFNVTHRKVTNDKIIGVDVRRQQHDLQHSICTTLTITLSL